MAEAQKLTLVEPASKESMLYHTLGISDERIKVLETSFENYINNEILTLSIDQLPILSIILEKVLVPCETFEEQLYLSFGLGNQINQIIAQVQGQPVMDSSMIQAMVNMFNGISQPDENPKNHQWQEPEVMSEDVDDVN